MTEKIINSRIKHKHATEADWKKTTGFTPLSGEIIIYSPDTKNPIARVKVGDGVTDVNDLEFVTNTSLGQNAITTAGSGTAYTVTVPGITELTVGTSFIMVTHVVSASTTPTLDLNGLGAKPLKRRLSNMATAVQEGYTETWLAAGLPFRVTYDGECWIVEGQTKPALMDLYGLTIDTRELSYLEGATSNIQDQLDEIEESSLTEEEIIALTPDVDDGTGSIPIASESMLGCVIAGEGLSIDNDGVMKVTLVDNAGAHNSVYRGKYLGEFVTDKQYAAISMGTFEDLYIGDYWVINNIIWRIAACDYYFTTGDIPCTKHHITIVPDSVLYQAQMNATNIVTGSYVGSNMYTTHLTEAKSIINNAFGESHVLSHRQFLKNTVTDGYETAGLWYDSTVELMTEQNVYGGVLFSNSKHGSAVATLNTVDKTQYPLFRYRNDIISNQTTFWLRDVAFATGFAVVSGNGNAGGANSSNSHGVRPAFSITA